MSNNDPNITICVVSHNSTDFIDVMLASFRILTCNPYKVLIRDNNSTEKERAKLHNLARQHHNVFVYDVQTEFRGSLDHGTGLNDLVDRIDTPYGVIIDADAMFLVKDWDKMLLDCLTDEMPIYGTQADVGSGKPEDFPLIFALVFRTATLKSLQIDFRPKVIHNYQDTGWELREKYLAAGYQGGLLYSFNTRNFKKGPFASVVCTEYYNTPDASGPIIASHFGRGSAPHAKRLIRFGSGQNLFYRSINKILRYANLIKWRRDKLRYLAICRSLIEASYERKD